MHRVLLGEPALLPALRARAAAPTSARSWLRALLARLAQRWSTRGGGIAQLTVVKIPALSTVRGNGL